MSILIKIVFLTITFNIFKSVICDHNKLLCKRNLTDSNNSVINETTYCSLKPCLITLCKTIGCQNMRDIPDLYFQDVYKFNDVGELEKTNKTIWDAFNIVTYQDKTQFENDSCISKSWAFLDGIQHKPHFLENGSLVIEAANLSPRYTAPCEDYVINLRKNKKTNTVKLYFKKIKTTSSNSYQNDVLDLLYAIGMFISCFFMILVLVIYATVKRLQNLVGYILMAFTGSLTGNFLFKASRELGLLYKITTVKHCTIISPITYFMQVSSLTWMNVLAFDIWWTFRATYYNRKLHRRGVWNKFMWYAAYAWGLPLLLTIAEVVIDNLDLQDYPNFVKPNFRDCTVGASKWYLLLPLTAILAVNLALFSLSVFNIWRSRKEISRFNKAETKKNKESENTFMLYLKMSVLAGLNWIFDVLSIFEVIPNWFQITAKIYNTFTGVIIFLAFAFKTRLLLELCRTYKIDNAFTRMLETRLNRNATFKSSRKTTDSTSCSGFQE